MKRRFFLAFLLLQLAVGSLALVSAAPQDYRTEENILYRSEADATDDAYVTERCRLDLYYPAGQEGFATVVWFHGGGLKAGNKSIPAALRDKGIAIAAANYRLHPQVKSPLYVQDAAAAVAWVFNHIEEYGGDPARIFVSGHSAGGYLTSMLGLDKGYLAEHGIDADQIAGLIPFSGHTITHFTVRTERGIPDYQAVVDEMAPLYHVRKDAPPLVLITGDRNLEMLGRYEENLYLWRMMQVAGHEQTSIYEIQGYNHGGMAKPAFPILLKAVRRILGSQD
ncbi:MAG: alpha/beta hydrolase [Acidobacteriota bacterium]|nr:MAG: alpha/beta hydrolase [Acidobacteriota bacterium]